MSMKSSAPRPHENTHSARPGFLELDDVDRRVDEDLAQQLDRRHVRARKVGRVHADDARGELGIHPGELPDEQAAPVVTGEHRALVAERGDEAGEATVDELDVVRDVGLVGAAVAGEVGSDDVEAGRGERVDLVAPRVRELGEPVTEEHERALARLEAVQPMPADTHIAFPHSALRYRRCSSRP